jgi:HSP90 family molecular chaperone
LVYSETDIFLCELNASNASDKLRYEAIANPGLIGEGEAPQIRIAPTALVQKSVTPAHACVIRAAR